MTSTSTTDPTEHLVAVGPFTGFANFLRKEIRDWWNSWRIIIVLAVPTLIQTLTVFFAYTNFRRLHQFGRMEKAEADIQAATRLLLFPFEGAFPALFIFIIIFATMGLLTTEKSTGTLAWNLTKPLGRSGLLIAKWLAATAILWVVMCVLPVVLASACMILYHHVTPDFGRMAPVVEIAAAWVGFWVLLVLTISLGFQSQGAVGGIAIAGWIVPFLFSALLGEVFGEETRDWILDRFAPSSPFWAYPLVADVDLMRKRPGTVKEWKEIWLYAFAVWTVVLSAFSLRIFSRQEIGS